MATVAPALTDAAGGVPDPGGVGAMHGMRCPVAGRGLRERAPVIRGTIPSLVRARRSRMLLRARRHPRPLQRSGAEWPHARVGVIGLVFLFTALGGLFPMTTTGGGTASPRLAVAAISIPGLPASAPISSVEGSP